MQEVKSYVLKARDEAVCRLVQEGFSYSEISSIFAGMNPSKVGRIVKKHETA